MRCHLLVLMLLMSMFGSVYGQEDFADINLDTYLHELGIRDLEGYVTPAQKAEFVKYIHKNPQIKKIMEIGFNAGHSAELFLENTDCHLVSFDINLHPYLKIGLEFITTKYGDRFKLIEGDSRIQVPKYASSHTDEKFDLIFIDGNHTFQGCLSDIKNCAKLANKETIVFIDDYDGQVKAAVDTCVQNGLISILEFSFTGNWGVDSRIWVVAKYLNID